MVKLSAWECYKVAHLWTRASIQILIFLMSAPEFQEPPAPYTQDVHSISLTWKLPKKTNGPEPKFTLYQSQVAFSNPPTEMGIGIRFPGDSYLKFSPSILPKDADYTGIRLKFKTFQSDCLLFFAASPLATDYTRHEYLVLQLRQGRPWFLFDLHMSPTAVTIDSDGGDDMFNDGKWHMLEVNRFSKDGFIEIDSIYTGSASSRGTSIVFGVNDGVFIGGLPENYNIARPQDYGIASVVNQNLIGCVKDIALQQDGMLEKWTNVTFEEAEIVHRTYDAWQGCPEYLSTPAAHFLGHGYLKLRVNIDAASFFNSWSLRMEVRFDFSSGILFYSAGKSKSFVMASVSNGTFR